MFSEGFVRDFFGMKPAAPEKPSVTERCGNCRFGFRTAGGFIECRRRAPISDGDHGRYGYSQSVHLFPTTTERDWCGDWEVVRV
jgi:hypothetical protein